MSRLSLASKQPGKIGAVVQSSLFKEYQWHNCAQWRKMATNVLNLGIIAWKQCDFGINMGKI